jgi:hypothetical protein
VIIKYAILLAIVLVLAWFATWAFLPARHLPGNRARHLRIRLHLRLHPGKGFAHAFSLWLHWSRFAVLRRSGQIRPALPWRYSLMDPGEHSVFLGRAHYRHQLRVPLEEHLLVMAPPRTYKTAFLADVIIESPLTVTLLAANLAVAAPKGIAVVETPTAGAMLDAALARADADLVLMAAAVADYRPAEQRVDKRSKNGAPWKLTLEPTDDILARLAAARSSSQVLVGFAAEQGDAGLARAREKLARKGVDAIVFNDISRGDVGFDAADNEVVIIEGDGERRVAKAPKDRIAAAIVERAEELLRERT